MLEHKTDLGDIRFSRSVIERIVEDAADACDGKVQLLNYKGKYIGVIPGSSIEFKETEDGALITAYIVVSFGASIRKYAGMMHQYIIDNVEKVMGEKPAAVKIIITGVQSREIARRHIEITE